MAQVLQDFREQYPQYADWSDEDLAQALHEQYYADRPIADYREEIGLPPLDAPTDPAGFPIDVSRPRLKNPDGSVSTEQTITVGFDDRFYNVPTIIDGRRVPEDRAIEQAREQLQGGAVFPNFASQEEAQRQALARSEAISRAIEEDERKNRPSFTERVNARLDSASRALHDMLTDEPDEGFDLRAFLLPEDEEPEPNPATPPRLRDQFFAGWDKYRANRANVAAFSTIETLTDVPAVARGDVAGGDRGGFLGVSGAQITKQARALRADAGDERAQDQIRQEIQSSREELVGTLRQLIDKRAELEYRQSLVPYSESTQRVVTAPTFGETLEGTLDDPVRVIAELSIRSAPNMADSIPLAVAGALAGPYGFAAGMGVGSAMAEYRNAFAEALTREGVDLSDAESMLAAAEDPALMTRARNYAKTRGAIIGTFDALSGGISGRQLTPFVKNAVAREMANVLAQTGVQATLGAAGEATAQVATGEELQPGEIMAEALGEGGTAIIDVGLASVSGTRAYIADQKAALIEAELNDFFGAAFRGDDPRGTDGGPDGTGGTPEPDQGALPPPAPEPEPDQGTLPPPPEAPTEPEPGPAPEPETPERPDVETVIRDDGKFEVTLDNDYENGARDVTVTDLDGRQVQLTLEPGETAEDAVKLVLEGEGDNAPPPGKAPDSAFNGDLESALEQSFSGEAQSVDLGSLGFTPEEIAGLEAEGLAADGRMSVDQHAAWLEERGRRLAGAPAPEVPDTPQPEIRDWHDARLKRSTYRGHLERLAGDLTPNGGVTYVFDEHQNIIGRTGSVNPPWFQDMNSDPATRMSVRRVQKAVDKAVTGKPLGVREKRVVDRMLGEIQDRRDEDVDAAREDLNRARELRRQARQNLGGPLDDEPVMTAGEYYAEDEYPAEMTAEARVIFELMEQAHQAGVTEDALERLTVQLTRDADLIEALEEAINEREQQAGAPAVPQEPEAGPEPGAPQPAEPKGQPEETEQTGDLFGQDVSREQAIADEIRRRDAARNQGQDELETGDPGDLFSQARQQADIEDVAQPAPLPADPANLPAVTGVPFRATVFTGAGREDTSAIYNTVALPLMGADAGYYAFAPETAENYGPNVQPAEVVLENPLVIETDEDFTAWHQAAGRPGLLVPTQPDDSPESVAKVRKWSEAMRGWAEAQGHDGIVVQFDPDFPGDFDERGSYKRLHQVWADPQVVVFNDPLRQARQRAIEAEPAPLPEPAEPVKRKKLTKIQEATLELAKRMPQPFNVKDILGMERPGTGKIGTADQAVNEGTVGVSQITGLIDKGYLELVEERGHLDWILRVPDDLRAEEPKNEYNLPSYAEDLSRYAAQPPVDSQAGAPRLVRAKSAALDALADLQSIPAVLPQSFARDLAANQRATLVGRTIADPLDLATAAQIYRDPRFETLRFFFLDDQDQVVAQLGMTSRLPASAEAFIGDDPNVFVAEMLERAKGEGAATVWLLHNHPSGESNPSEADERLTRLFSSDVRKAGLDFRGHVVIDQDNYSVISSFGDIDRQEADLRALDMAPTGGIAGKRVTGPLDIVPLFHGLTDLPADQVVIVTADTRHRLRSLGAVHVDRVKGKTPAQVRRVAQRALLEDGASALFVVGRDRDALVAFDGVAVDAIALDDEGIPHSLAAAGGISGGRRPWPENTTRARITAATSEAFDYLRPLAVRQRRPAHTRTIPPQEQQMSIEVEGLRRDMQRLTTDQGKLIDDMGDARRGLQPTAMDWTPLGLDAAIPAERQLLIGAIGEALDQVNTRIRRTRAALSEMDQILNNAALGRMGGAAEAPASQTEILEEINGLQEDLKRLERGQEPETFKTMIFEIDATTPEDVDQVWAQIIGRLAELNQQLQASAYQVQESRDERRVNPKLRARISKMSIEELIEELYTDPLTGLANRRAFNEEHDDHAWLASIDVDSLKWINDNLGPDAGDAMLVAVGEALDQPGIEAYHLSGDEYYLGGDNREELEAALTLAAATLGQQTLSSPRGQKVGINITWGLGQSKAVADADMKGQKVRRQEEGKRAGREEAPPGITLSVKGQQLDMEPGTNYVPMIGRHGELPINANHEYVLGNGRIVRIPKKPIRREHILALMQRRFGNRIYEGRVKGRMRLGFYRPGHGEIRIKNANDIEVAAHEVAHWLDDRYPWIERLYKSSKGIQEEVKSVSYDISKVFEGYAEFMRLFFTQEHEAMARAPGFYEAWTKALEDHPKLRDIVYDLQELMHAWTQQGARARLASKHGSAPPSIRERMALALPREGLIQAALDGLRSWKLAELDIGDDGTYRAYEKLRLALGGSSGVLEALMYYGTPGFRADDQGLEFTGDGLLQVFGDLWGDPDQALYMLARRAQELAGQGRENLFRPDEIAAGLSIAEERPEVVEAFEGWLALNQRMLDFFEDSGILGPATRRLIEDANQNYVPFNRVVESEIEGRRVRQGGNPWMRLKGGTSNVNVIWENIINNYGWLIRLALVNDGKREFYNKILATQRSLRGKGGGNQQAGLWAAPIGKDVRAASIQSEQVLKKAVEAMGWTMKQYKMAKEGFVSGDEDIIVVDMIDRMAEGLGEMTTFFLLGQDPRGYVDAFLHNGKSRWFEIGDPGLWDSIQFLGPKGTNLVLRILGGFTTALRRGVVSVPVFQTKNFIRDTTNAWLLTDHIKVPAISALRIVFSKMMQDPDYQEMLLNGGGFANRLQGLQTHWRHVIDPSRVVAMYDRFMGRFENANRLAEYKAARAAGKTPRRAAFLSREISTDFAMRGSSAAARVLAIAVPFLNARAEGNYRAARQMTERERALSYALRGSALMVATLALYALNKDDERYKELPEYIKDLNWVFFTGAGEDEYFLVPKPFESGMLWGTIPERMFELTEERDGKEFADAMGWMFLQTFNMDMTPQLFAPWRDLSRNEDFTGAPVIPFYLDNVAPSEQYSYYTSETMRLAGEQLDLSPMKMQHVFEGYLGTLGTYVLGMSDAIVRSTVDLETGEEPTRGETWRENILVRAIADPLISEGPPRRTKYVNDFYQLMRESEQVAKTTALLEKRHSEKLEAFLEDPENQVNYAIYPVLSSIRSELNEIRRAMDLVRQDAEMSGDVKRGELWEMTRQRNRLLREAVQQVKEAKRREQMELMQPQRRASGQ